MATLTVYPQTHPLRGTITPPGDKSISHRVLLFGALAEGVTRAQGWLPAEDCLATLRVLRALGVEVAHSGTTVELVGRGLRGLREPEEALDCGGSGTTMRLLAGILAGQPFSSLLVGNEALRRRPMGRVAQPLRRMGATISSRDGDGREQPPLAIRGGPLHPLDYDLPVASAQVKSALLLAALYADGPTTLREPGPARDHTERLLRAMGARLDIEGRRVTIHPLAEPLRPLRGPDGGAYRVPGDPSSAAFPLLAATLVTGSEVRLEGVGTNPTRTGLLDLLAMMGAPVALERPREEEIEPVADWLARTAPLSGIEVGGEVVVRAIDEFPILAVAATQADGVTTVRDAAELRVKESDRIAAVARELGTMGARLDEGPDGFTVRGPVRLRGGDVDSHMDHRLAMALAVAALVADGPTTIHRAEVIADSYPGFVEDMVALGAWMEFR